MDPKPPATLERYRNDLRGVVGSGATAYGYTLTV
jgi:protein involved in ribonucleotide reduction